jgi:hypothetical protein
MNDEQLTKELEEALAVEPTPQFLARVRREIEAEGRRPAVRLMAAGVAVAAVILGIVLFHPENPTTVESSTASQIVRPLPAAEISITFVPSTPTVTKGRSTQASGHSAQPEFLMDLRETAALQSFLQDVQERKIDPARLEGLFQSAEKVRNTTIAPMPIAAIEPIVITPLSSAEPETGGDL